MASDINLSQLIFQKVPEKWHPYIKLARLDRPIGIWLLLFPCWWGIILAAGGITNVTLETMKLLFLFAIGAVLMRAAGCVINDLWDQKIDAAVERTKERPLASGEISVPHALRFLAALLALSLIVLIMLPHLTIVLGVFSILLVIAYPAMKRLTWMPQLFLGLVFNWGALMGWAAVNGSLAWGSLLLYFSGIFWTLGYDTIYAHQDKEDDLRIGIKSTALLWGDKSRQYITVFYALSLLCLLFAKYTASPNMLTPLLLALPAYHVYWQMKHWDMNDPQSCLMVFRSNQVYGWLVLLMLSI